MRGNFGWALASVVSLGISGLASAADLPVYRKAPAPIVETYNWTGFYVGLEGGGDFGRTQVIHGPNDPRVGLPNIPETNAFNTTAGLAGVVAGYNYQINQVVLGIEGDFSGVWARPLLLTSRPSTQRSASKLNNVGSQPSADGWVSLYSPTC